MKQKFKASYLRKKPARRMTFGDAATHWLETRNYKKATVRGYRNTIDSPTGLGPYLNMPLADMAQKLRQVNDHIRDHPNARWCRTIIEGTMNLAAAEGDHITSHRLGGMTINEKPRRIKALVPHDASQLNTIIEGMPGNAKLAVLLMRGCGLRAGEVFALHTDDFHDGIVEVKRELTGSVVDMPKQRREGFTPRRVPVPHWLTSELEAHVGTYCIDERMFPALAKVPGGYRGQTAIAPRQEGKNPYRSQVVIRDYFRPAVEKAGLPATFTTHQLRKNWATQFRTEQQTLGIDQEDYAEWAGHTKLTQSTYAFQSNEAINKGRNLSDPRIER